MSNCTRNQYKNKIAYVDNEGWTKMKKAGKPPKSDIKINSITITAEDDDETKQLKRAIELSLNTTKSNKSKEEKDIELAIKLSIEHDIMINSSTEFPTISGEIIISNGNGSITCTSTHTNTNYDKTVWGTTGNKRRYIKF